MVATLDKPKTTYSIAPGASIASSQYPELMRLINGTYLDRVEQIVAAEVDANDNIIAVALDGQKKLAVRITDDDISIKLMGGEQAANSLKFAAPKKKPKKCSKGISCGLSCISATKTCRKKTSPTQKAQKQKIVKEAKAAPKAAKEKAAKPVTTELGVLQGEIDKRRKALVDAVGLDLVEKAENNVQKILDKSVIQIRVSRRDIDTIISNGVFKSAFELGSKDASYMKHRSALERDAMGYALDTKATRPIYGYLADKGTVGPLDVSDYGGIAIEMKPNLKARSTLIIDDSLNTAKYADDNTSEKIKLKITVQPSKITKVSAATLKSTYLSDQAYLEKAAAASSIKDLSEYHAYVEAQMHGGVKTSDIQAIYMGGVKPSDKLLEWAAQNKVKINP